MVLSIVHKQGGCGQAMVASSWDTTESQLVAGGQSWGCSCWQLGGCSWDFGEAAWCCRAVRAVQVVSCGVGVRSPVLAYASSSL